VPGCPPHPDWIVGTLVTLMLYGKDGLVAQLDEDRRPKEFFSDLVHDNCPRRSAFDAGIFVSDFNDNVTGQDGCLLTKGCKGPLTHADCPSRRWNQRINWCIGAGAPCVGCTEPAFYAGLSPLSEMLPSVKLPGTRPVGVSADVVGKAIGAATAIGIGAHAVTQVAKGKIGPRRIADVEDREQAGPVEPPSAGSQSAAEPGAEPAVEPPAATAETPGETPEPAVESPPPAEDPGGAGAPSVPTGYFGPRRAGEDSVNPPESSKDATDESPSADEPGQGEGDDS